MHVRECYLSNDINQNSHNFILFYIDSNPMVVLLELVTNFLFTLS